MLPVTRRVHPLRTLVLGNILPLTNKTFQACRTENLVIGYRLRRKTVNYCYKFFVPSNYYIIHKSNRVDSSNGACFTDFYPCSPVFAGRRCIHLSSLVCRDPPKDNKDRQKPSSKIEQTVKVLEEELEKTKEQGKVVVEEQKRPLYKRILAEILHYYHGTRLLLVDVKISTGLLWRILKGKKLTRREYRQLIRTTSDLFRLLPFSVFIIIPFMELLLPVFVKMFPNMLPSTFQSNKDREFKLKGEMKVKLEMAKFLQKTLHDMAPEANERTSQLAKEFAEFIQKIRISGSEVTTEEILKYSKLFEDEITLDSLSREQLMALCKVLEIPALGTSTILRFQLRLRLRNLIADDKVIESEGIDKLNYRELQNACKARGMRAVGVQESRLRRQLHQWLTLSLHEKVPASLLLLTRAMYLSENIPTTQQLQATLQALPDAATLQTKAAIGEREGKIDHKTRIELIKEEERKIKEERQEHRLHAKLKEEQELAKRELLGEEQPPFPGTVDPVKSVENHPHMPNEKDYSVQGTINLALFRTMPETPVFVDTIASDEFDEIESIISKIGKDNKLLIELEEIRELKTEISDYVEDVHELEAISEKAQALKIKVKECKGARRLKNKLNTMVGKLDETVASVDAEAKEKKACLQKNLVATEELLAALQKAKDVKDPAKLARIAVVFSKLDNNRKIELDDLVKVIDVVGKEHVNLSSKQLEELVRMLAKEELLNKDEEKVKLKK